MVTVELGRGTRGARRAVARLGTVLLGLAFAAGPAEALNFVVNSTLDTADAGLNNVCDVGGGVCTLRAAIQESNFGGVGNTITFNITPLGGVKTIAVNSTGLGQLPPITRAVTIDGYTQGVATPNSLAVGNNAVLLVELNGAATLAGANGLTVNVAGVTIRGLVINRFAAYGILVNGGGTGVTIRGNFVGTNPAGTAASGNSRVDAVAGIGFFGGGAMLGGTAPADRNLVSGHNANGARGIQFWDSSNNTIQGNYVGTNAAGTAALPNVGAGLALDGAGTGSDNNLVGGTVAGAGNLFARGGNEGVAVYTVSTGNAILGNSIVLNGGLGIDLGGNGVTGNDPGDGDGGPNNQLNFPVISGVSVVGTSLVVSFSLDVPAGSYRVEFFRNPSGVDVPNGEGEVFAGFVNVSHPGGGSRSFSATINGAAGDRITATTTLCSDGATCSAFSDTSEFSANLIATPINYRSIGTAPDSSAGSLNTTNNSLIVTGVGTAWRTINRGRGDVISICDQAFPTCTTSTNYTVLAVSSDNQLTLTTPYTGTTGNHGYTIRRQFTTLTAWEDCIDGPGGVACTFFPVASSNLIGDNRSEVGIAYNDTAGPDFAGGLTIDGSGTDANHTITLTADGVNRHFGLSGQGVLVNNGASVAPAIQVLDDYVTVEWIEITGGGGTADGIRVNLLSPGTSSLVTVRNNLIRNITGDGVGIYDPDGRVDVVNNFVHSCSTGACSGIWLNSTSLAVGSRFRVLNNTVYGNASGIAKAGGVSAAATLLLRNNISVGSTAFPDYDGDPADSVDPASSNNLDEDNSGGTGAGTHNPAGGRVTSSVAAVAFVNAGAGDLHILPSSSAKDVGADLSSMFTTDIDGLPRSAPWDIGADETGAIALYRSVGITATALATGGANALTIAGSTATFASPLPANVGVGDVIQYDSDNNGSIDALAFIHGRNSGQSFTVKNKNGVAATATVAADLDWSVFRAYTGLANWENGIENPNILEPVENDVNPAPNLVTANTVMHVACYADGADAGSTYIDSWDTGPNNHIRIYTPYLSNEVGTSQRHSGVWTTSAYRLLQDASYFAPLGIRERYVRVDGLQLEANQVVATESNGIHIGDSNADLPVEFHISNNIIRSITAATPLVAFGIGALNNFDVADNSLYIARIWNNIVYGFVGTNSSTGIYGQNNGTIYAYNNTVVGAGATHRGFARFNTVDFHAKNNISINSVTPYQGVFNAASTNNFSDVGGAPGLNPKTRDGAGADPIFVGGADYHLHPTDTWARDQGANLSADASLPIFDDIDRQTRIPVWDIGADDASGTTAVKLMSFEAVPADAAVVLGWRTASELDNLGFHVYRALAQNGPWARVSTSLIPGLGSSAVGRAYSFRDSGLANGVRYFYRLDDVDASSRTTSHGPVSAVPAAGAAEPAGSEARGASARDRKGAAASCPDWVLAAYGSAAGSDAAAGALRCTRHGDPEAASLGVVARDTRQATLELRTGGFYALHVPPGAGEPAGTVRVFVPGFDVPLQERQAALPVRRALADALVGRRVQLGRVRALDLASFNGLVPAGLGPAEMQLGQDGTVRATRRAAARDARRSPRSAFATLLPSLFQGERKSAVVEIAPLRFEAERRRLVLARRVLVTLLFTGRETGESGRGSLGRAPRAGKPPAAEVLARLYTTGVGLHRVGFEQLFPGRARAIAAQRLRLERQGEPVRFHLEPAADSFGPGGRLYFYAERAAASTDFTGELAFELTSGAGGLAMPLQPAAPGASLAATASTVERSFETNRFYQPGLLAAEDPWLWEAIASGATRAVSFTLAGVAGSGGATAELDVLLQGASESGRPPDHHVSVSVNGALAGETQFAGKQPHRIRLSLPASLLREGANQLTLTNVADTGVSSLVFLDRFSLTHPQSASAGFGLFEGTWAERGTATVSGLSSAPVIVDVTAGATGATWLHGYQAAGGDVRFHAEAGRRYLLVSQEALRSPRVAAAAQSSLRAPSNRADYLLIAPRAFLAAAAPLVKRRQDQGLEARAVAFEEIADGFGHGQPTAAAIQAFLAYAFQSWARPSPRYVLLLGDSSYDPRGFTANAQPSPLPALWAKTSYLWTVSDPLLAAVNGDDPLPDLAIGRLPAATAEQAQALVDKLLAWEDSGQGLSAPATLVADNPDIAGDFEADVRDIAASFLAGRSELLLLRELGAETRSRVLDAFNSGRSFVSYVGHGGAAVWASENVWNSWDAASLQAQSLQPLLVTMNCLNGYFVAPTFESLAESLLKAEGRGAIAAFSPSGLSLDGPAHAYHRALLAELTSGQHQRLGDAVLAAQASYARTGLMPELLSVYHLLGDPATVVR